MIKSYPPFLRNQLLGEMLTMDDDNGQQTNRHYQKLRCLPAGGAKYRNKSFMLA